MIYLWIVFALFDRFKAKKCLACSIAAAVLIMIMIIIIIINVVLSNMISELFLMWGSGFHICIIFIVGVILFVRDKVKHKR